MKKYTKDHEWIELAGDSATVGISDHAQDALGDIVFVELPAVGKSFAVGDEAAVIESVKAAGEVKNPAAGEIVAVNNQLTDNPGLINSAPEGDGWIYKIKLSDPSQLDGLMDEAAYQSYLNS